MQTVANPKVLLALAAVPVAAYFAFTWSTNRKKHASSRYLEKSFILKQMALLRYSPANWFFWGTRFRNKCLRKHFVPELTIIFLRIATRKPEAGRGKVRVTQLVIYPLKSAKGIYVDRAELGPYGFKYDRQWYWTIVQKRKKFADSLIRMIVSEKEKRFITQRQVSKLALVIYQYSQRSLSIQTYFSVFMWRSSRRSWMEI